jgi:RNA-directed DNA polymerase
MSLTPPEKIQTLQQKLYEKAKQESTYRFYRLYDKVYRDDILIYAYELSRANAGAPGVDGETFEAIEARGLGTWLAERRKELHEKTYRPDAVRRVMIAKPGGGERPLGIPTVRDRVIQTAAKLVLEPIFEADFEESAYGYRPNRNAQQAVQEVHRALIEGYTQVVDADVSKYFDTIPHSDLMASVARRISDKHMLHLIKMWLKAAIEERDERGNRRRRSSGNSGTPQGGVLSPLLANVYMNRFLRAWRERGKGAEFRAKLVNYADDFVVLSRGRAREALDWVRWAMGNLGLTLNETKTRIADARNVEFDFLGYTFGPERMRKTGRRYLAAKPSRRSVQRVKQRIGTILRQGNPAPWDVIARHINRVLLGWSGYFSYGTRLMAYRAVENHVDQRVRAFLRKRHKVSSRGTQSFPSSEIFGRLGILRMVRLHLGPPA